jgi:hypothetical protein
MVLKYYLKFSNSHILFISIKNEALKRSSINKRRIKIMNTLDYAIKMEYDGEKFYREQAQINKDNGLHIVCNLLAEEEKKHAQILESKKNQSAYKLIDSDFLSNAQNVYTGSKGIEVEGTNYPSQLDFSELSATWKRKVLICIKNFYLKRQMMRKRNYMNF